MHFHELTNSLNHRTFTIRRISNQVPQKQLLKVVQSIWMSKLRYGLNLCNRVRMKTDDPTNKFMKAIQICQNKMLRMLDRVSLNEHVTTKSLLNKYKLASVNQLSAEIKLLEAWKAVNITNYPFQMEKNNPDRIDTGRDIRSTSIKDGEMTAKRKQPVKV